MSPLPAHVRANVELAAACGVPPAMIVTIALMTTEASSVAEAISFIADHREELEEIARNASPLTLRSLATLEPELQFTPEVARIRPDIRDHELRGKLVFGELVGRVSFFQLAALAIDGLTISRQDADLLEQLGINTQLADARIWPLTITRRAAWHAGAREGLVAGVAAMTNPNMAVAPVGAFMDLLARLEAGRARGESDDAQLKKLLSVEKIPGVGRPVLGPDERNAHVVELARRFSRDGGENWKAAWRIHAYVTLHKGLHINSAGLQGALMRDIGFSARGAIAFCTMYFVVQVLAQSSFAREQRESAGHSSHR